MSIIRKIHYLSGGAVLIQNHGVDSLLYGYTDYQGSLVMLTDESGNVLEEYAYDRWGARRDPNDWSQKDNRTHWLLNRGYTGHEHLDAFAIINMNGRVYDPLTAAFFSPDPFIQTPDDWLNYNRYSYVLNNPMKYTDPTGNLFYLGIGYSWSWYGGSSLSISFGYGFSGGLSIGFTGGYGFKDGNYFATVNASAAGYYGYGGYDTKGGFICGAGYGIGGNKYSGNVGFMIYTNLLDISVNFSEQGGWTANVFGMQYSRNGVIFDPSLGGGFTLKERDSERSQTSTVNDMADSNGLGSNSFPYSSNEAMNQDIDFKFPLLKYIFRIRGIYGYGVLDFMSNGWRYERDNNGNIYKYDGEGRSKFVLGCTRPVDGKYGTMSSNIYLSQSLGPDRIFKVLNHELFHAFHIAIGIPLILGKNYLSYTERIAYEYSYSIGMVLKTDMLQYSTIGKIPIYSPFLIPIK